MHPLEGNRVKPVLDIILLNLVALPWDCTCNIEDSGEDGKKNCGSHFKIRI